MTQRRKNNLHASCDVYAKDETVETQKSHLPKV